MAKVLVSGGCGYIGSHTIIDLIEKGFEVISIDNNMRSYPFVVNQIKDITGVQIENHCIDLCDLNETENVFKQHKFEGIIHFAALKSVPESMKNPLLYYHNNIASLMNLLELTEKYKVPHFVFSSSCAVYGNTTELPVTETTQWSRAESPYGHTKQIGENIIENFTQICASKFIALRYFNPIGAHPSIKIGESPLNGITNNIIPRMTGAILGYYDTFEVFGNDYNTPDGTCIRDYIHVMDIASAHTLALQNLFQNKQTAALEAYNLGLGKGVSILEIIHSFEKTSGKKLNYKVSPRRIGDVEAIFANSQKAIDQLNWKINFTLDDMTQSAWRWDERRFLENIK